MDATARPHAHDHRGHQPRVVGAILIASAFFATVVLVAEAVG